MQTNFANVTARTTDWNGILWCQAHRVVRNLRQRIFKATQKRDWNRVRGLQRLLLKSYSNVLLSVRRVTQINRGKHTPGIDHLLVKTAEARGILVDVLKQFIPWQPLATRRVYIPKRNGKQRPLGIPSLIDRCLQAIVKEALEPCWEAQFEWASYGFRPGRSAHDAIAKIYVTAVPSHSKKWVVDADIAGCFDQINQEFLLQQIGNFPARRLIAQWLKAGYLEKGQWHTTDTGTPQGGIVSPLLANIALHGMEAALGVRRDKRGLSIGDRILVRYADDFVVFCTSQREAEATLEMLKNFLQPRGLTLSDEKTQIVHLSEGFDFLGYNIRHYPVSTTRTGWKLLIKPAKASVLRFQQTLKDTLAGLKGKNARQLIQTLNPIIRGWANYFRNAVSSETFSKLEHFVFWKVRRWISRSHPNQSFTWRNQRYWTTHPAYPSSKWCFVDAETGMVLYRIGYTRIQRHVLIAKDASPDNPDLKAYFEQRREARTQQQDYPVTMQRALQRQKGICPRCRQSLFNGEDLHLHHKTPRHQGGSHHSSNLAAVHLMCHLQIHGKH